MYIFRSFIGTLLKDNGDGELSVGDKYEYEVKPGEKQKFYVLKVEDDKVNLIMDRNICEDGTTDYREDNNYCRVGWGPLNDNSTGPITAMTYVGNATSKWKNVSNVNLMHDDKIENEEIGVDPTYGYIGVTITDGVGYITKKDGTKTSISLENNMMIKARLPKISEVKASGCNKSMETCPVWLIENLRYDGRGKYSINSEYISGTPIYNINGYWLISSYSIKSFSSSLIHRDGYISGNNAYLTNDYGVRPVITVSKYDLS